MEHLRTFLITIAALLLVVMVSYAAFPADKTNWVTNDILEPSWLNAIEDIIGAWPNGTSTPISQYILSSTSSLGVFGSLASTTGNLIVGSSGSWIIKTVGLDGYKWTASSTATGGMSWEPDVSASDAIGVVTSSLGIFSHGNIGFFTDGNTLNATNTLNISTTTGMLQFFGHASTTQFTTPSSTITTLLFTNASGTDITLTGNLVSTVGSFTTVSSTRLQLTGEFDVAGRTDLTVVSSTNATFSGSVTVDTLAINGNAKLATSSKAFALVDTNTSTYKFGFALSASAVTITEITCIVDQTTGSDEQEIYIWEASGVTTSSIDASVDPITCTGDGVVDDGSITDASIAAGNRIFVQSLAGTASGTPNFVTAEIYFKL